jgi:hypothetical protein
MNMKRLLVLSIFLIFPLFFVFSQHASPLDVWKAGAQFGSQALDTLSQEKKIEDDRILFLINNDLKMESNKFLISLYSRIDFNNFFPLWYARRDSLFKIHLSEINDNYSFDGLNYIYIQNDASVTKEINKIVFQKWEESGKQENITYISWRPLPSSQNRSSGSGNSNLILPTMIVVFGVLIGGVMALSM